MSSLGNLGWPIKNALFTTTGSCNRTASDVFNAIRNRYKTKVEDVISGGMPTQHDNEPFTTPTKGHWARFTIIPGDDFRTEIGAQPAFRKPGIVQVLVFDNLNKGSKEIDERADFIAEQFRSVTESDISFGAAIVGKSKRVGNKWQVLVILRWKADYIC